MLRGVIAAPGIITKIPNGFIMQGALSAEELRYYVLYCDKVMIPGNNLVYTGIPEEEKLIACNAISRPRVTFHGDFIGDQVANATLSCHSIVAKQLASDPDIDWVIHQIGETLLASQQQYIHKDIIRVSLSNALPVPHGDIDRNRWGFLREMVAMADSCLYTSPLK